MTASPKSPGSGSAALQSRPPRFVRTTHAALAFDAIPGDGAPIVFIHGNSSCRKVFDRQLASRALKGRRMVRLDLPGHGASDNAYDPARTYCRAGLADCLLEALDELEVGPAVIVGWSLGGHVAIEMLARSSLVRGLVITGTPPVRSGRFTEAFVGSPAAGLPGKATLSPEEIGTFAAMMIGRPPPTFVKEAIARTDRRFRPALFDAAGRGDGHDQALAVKDTLVPIAVVNGAEDTMVRLDYLDGLPWGNLWRKTCFRLAGVGHAAHWQAAETFNALLQRFVADVEAEP